MITREVDRLSGAGRGSAHARRAAEPRLAPLNIHRVIQEVVARDRPRTDRARHSRYECDFDPSLPDVRGDEAQLSQVFLNLLTNASKP